MEALGGNETDLAVVVAILRPPILRPLIHLLVAHSRALVPFEGVVKRLRTIIKSAIALPVAATNACGACRIVELAVFETVAHDDLLGHLR